MTEDFDAIVVGAGAAGGWAAKELTERGLRVLLLEAGRPLQRRDFPTPAPAEARLRSRVAALVGGQGVQMRCAAFNARTRGFFVHDRDNPYTTPAGEPFNWFRGRQVGGRLPVWARVAPRLSTRELHAATRDGHGADWPLALEELQPFYDRVEALLGLDDIAMTPGEERFRAAVEGAFPARRVGTPRLLRPDRDPTPAPLRAALATGRLVLRPHAVARSITVDPATGRARGVTFADALTRAPEEGRGRIVVLCASTIETLRIMLNSTSRAHPRGLGNSSGRLGMGIMDHVLTGIGGPLPRAEGRGQRAEASDGDPYDQGRVAGLLVAPFRNVDGADAGFLRSYAIQGAVGRGTDTWYLLAHGEMLARDRNRVTLHPSRTDAWGVPVAHIACALTENEVAMAADQMRVMRELAGAAGLAVRTPPSGRSPDALAFRLWRRRLVTPSGAFLPGSSAHEIGGAGMGDNPGRSVLDPFGRCWDAENVFVTDGACFPAGCWQNVTLTIMALTARACGRIADDLDAGRL